MAENDRCAKRRPVGDLHTVFADHHEWRFLRQDIRGQPTPDPDIEHDTYYCVFCLELKHRKVEYGLTTQYR